MNQLRELYNETAEVLDLLAYHRRKLLKTKDSINRYRDESNPRLVSTFESKVDERLAATRGSLATIISSRKALRDEMLRRGEPIPKTFGEE